MLRQSFLQYLQYEKRYSTHTIAAYQRDLDQLEAFLQQQSTPIALTEAHSHHIRQWMLDRIQRGDTTRTINRKLSSCKSFYRFALRKKAIPHDPMQKVTAPKVRKTLPAYIENKPMAYLLECMAGEEGFEPVRNRLIIELLYATGIRRAELIGLQVGDVQLERKTIKVLGKGNKERMLPISPALVTTIKAYLSLRMEWLASEGLPDNGAFFITAKGKPLYPKLVYNIVTSALSLVTTQQKRSPHVLRHTFATQLLNAGADINAIKELLGHASLAATQVYTHNDIETLKQAYRQAHPRA